MTTGYKKARYLSASALLPVVAVINLLIGPKEALASYPAGTYVIQVKTAAGESRAMKIIKL